MIATLFHLLDSSLLQGSEPQNNTFVTLLQVGINKAIPVILFGALSLAAGLLALLLPETRNRKLPETVQDGEQFERYCSLSQLLVNTNASLLRSSIF